MNNNLRLSFGHWQAICYYLSMILGKSEHFRPLRGAMNLIKEPYERVFRTISRMPGMEEI
jgi:hypothetical protein